MPRQSLPNGSRSSKLLILRRLLLLAVCVGTLIFILLHFDTQEAIGELFSWLHSLGPWAPSIFVILDVIVVVLLLPGIVLTMGAGFLFGLYLGTSLILLATTVGGSIAFLSARYLFSERATAYLKSHPKLRAISDEFTADAWKIVMLTRLVPFFPFKLSNYFFGVTNFSFGHYLIGTLIGIIPNTVFLVYLGSLTADIAKLNSAYRVLTPWHWVSYGFGAIAMMGSIAFIIQRSRTALRRYIPVE
ncbi:MAG: putative membrane protein YdjX (TVP38/TMEM64 family) [Gammaproteobacteria bacterium]|jgi:uncharacterized membrane protein YdjX (TVP38/TMEM64 family)